MSAGGSVFQPDFLKTLQHYGCSMEDPGGSIRQELLLIEAESEGQLTSPFKLYHLEEVN